MHGLSSLIFLSSSSIANASDNNSDSDSSSCPDMMTIIERHARTIVHMMTIIEMTFCVAFLIFILFNFQFLFKKSVNTLLLLII